MAQRPPEGKDYLPKQPLGAHGYDPMGFGYPLNPKPNFRIYRMTCKKNCHLVLETGTIQYHRMAEVPLSLSTPTLLEIKFV